MYFDRSIYQPSEWGQRFHTCNVDELLGGGAAGPGKSLALLWDPIICQGVVEQARATQEFPVGFPEWLEKLCREFPLRPGMSEAHALHMRREFPEHEENIARSLRMFRQWDPDAVYIKDVHSWEFSSGMKFTFGHCREKKDYVKYLSKQYTHEGFDEAGEFEEEQYEELDGRVRSGDPILQALLRTRLCSNPWPGWLKKRFVDMAPEGNKVFRFRVVDPSTGDFKYKTRMFMPARLDDNPDKVFVRDYKFKLLSKPAHMRRRYLEGDWNSVEGGYFDDDWNPNVHVIKPFKVPREWPKFRSMDWGYKDYGVIGWWAMDPDENMYLFYEFTFRLMKDRDVAKRVVELEKMFGFWNRNQNRSRLTGVADTQLWEERGDSGKSKAQVFAEAGVFWTPADKDNLERHGERISMRLRSYDQHRPPGLMFFDNCKKTIEAIPAIPVDDKDSTKYSKKSPVKHWVDMVAYAVARASRGRRTIPMELHELDMPDRSEEMLEDLSEGGIGRVGYGL